MSKSVNSTNDLMVYQTDSGALEVRFDGKHDTVWLSQAQMVALFGSERSVITKHLRNVFAEAELEQNSVCANFAHTAADGKTYQVEHYNLDVIISVGYRVKSKEGTRFRQWATRTLREHLTQGFTVNQARLAQNVKAFEAALELVQKAAASPELSSDMGRGLVDVLARYAQTFLLLQQYDEGLLYSACCEPFHGSVAAPTAQALVRSRYSAYVLNLKDYLLLTWHASTRPDYLDEPEEGLKWLGLTVKKAWVATEDEAFVEFVARYKVGGGKAERLHEGSRFVREHIAGEWRWFYVDGEFVDGR